jgi:origin recognition complex subunit 3
VKRKPSTSVANYDINFLIAWYKALVESTGKKIGFSIKTIFMNEELVAGALNLVIVLHDFEQFNPSVMEDVFYICRFVYSSSDSFVTIDPDPTGRMHVSQIPIVFLLSLSSPTPEYLQITYPRSTLALLRVRHFNVPSGIRILQQILLKVCNINIDFEWPSYPTDRFSLMSISNQMSWLDLSFSNTSSTTIPGLVYQLTQFSQFCRLVPIKSRL